MVAWIVVILGAVSVYFSVRYLWARAKAEEGGDTTRYRQGMAVWFLEVIWLLGSWLLLIIGVYMLFLARSA